MRTPSARTVPTTIRITPTQYSELKKHPISSSVIIRVLLDLWLSNRIDIDSEIAEENLRTERVVVANQLRFTKENAA